VPRILAIALAGLLACVFAGCGSGSSSPPAPSGEAIERNEDAEQAKQEAAELAHDRELLSTVEGKQREEDATVNARRKEQAAATRAKKRIEAAEKEAKAKEQAAEAAIKRREAALKAKIKEQEEAARKTKTTGTPKATGQSTTTTG
jgi:hypothetical protein